LVISAAFPAVRKSFLVPVWL